MAAICCIGAAHLDRTARALGPVAMASSNPVSVTESVGGVAANVARVAARLGADVSLVGLVGDDEAGRSVCGALEAEGIAAYLTAQPQAATATYTAFLDDAGALVVALADMAIYDRLTSDRLDGWSEPLGAAPLWFADANLPAETLRALAGSKPSGTRLFADAVSVAKAPRLAGVALDGLFLNVAEAQALFPGRSLSEIADEMRAASRCLALSFGGDGCLVIDEAGVPHAMPAFPSDVHDATGAGDAMVGGTLAALESAAEDWAAAVRRGLGAAALVLEGEGSVPANLTHEAHALRVAITAPGLPLAGDAAMERFRPAFEALP